MNEPITVASAKLTDALCNAIRDSGVPAFICRYILHDIDVELEKIAAQQLQQDRAMMEAQKQSEEQKQENEGDAPEVQDD